MTGGKAETHDASGEATTDAPTVEHAERSDITADSEANLAPPAADPEAPRAAPMRRASGPMQILELRAGRLRAALRPDLGGAVAGLWLDGVPVLSGCEPRELASIDDAACLPCAPFALELGRGALRWMDTNYQLERHASSAHALHGVAWLRRWDIVAVSARAAEIRYRHWPDDAWPFAFDVHQIIEVKPTSLAIQLVLTNRHDAPQPAGLGWQMAFARPEGTRATFSCRERWDLEPTTRMPSGKVAVSKVSGAIDSLELDHTYEGWGGALRVNSPSHALRLHSSLDRLAISTKTGDTVLRAGPVSHAPDAFHMASPTANGLEVLPPEASIEAWTRLDVRR